MIKTITKTDIIEALRTEPLAAGEFFKRDICGLYQKGCAVCAVGAVLRKASFETYGQKKKLSLHQIAVSAVDSDSYMKSASIKENLSNKKYLAALSCYFEDVSRRRSDLIKFVKKNFPARLEINVNIATVDRYPYQFPKISG